MVPRVGNLTLSQARNAGEFSVLQPLIEDDMRPVSGKRKTMLLLARSSYWCAFSFAVSRYETKRTVGDTTYSAAMKEIFMEYLWNKSSFNFRGCFSAKGG
jgi:hypothetical protein